jgi:hypothetical protein
VQRAAFAHLCRVAPIPASSGKTTRHRLHRGGNRDANRALWVIAMGRLRWDARTRADVARRTAQGKTKLEIIRCLIGGVSGVRSAQASGRARGAGQGTAPLSCHPTMARLSSAAPGRAEPHDRLQDIAPARAVNKAPATRARSATSSRLTASRSADRCLLAGTGPAPPTT